MIRTVSVKVSIIWFSRHQIHPKGVSMFHDADTVGHDALLVQTGVTVEDDIVSIL